MSTRSVLVQFVHASFPVSADVGGRVTDRDGPLDLPISDRLREDFRTWSAAMERAFSARIQGLAPVRTLNDQGLELARRLSDELGTAYRVEYFDEVVGSWLPVL